jgi:hypothetical protein
MKQKRKDAKIEAKTKRCKKLKQKYNLQNKIMNMTCWIQLAIK